MGVRVRSPKAKGQRGERELARKLGVERMLLSGAAGGGDLKTGDSIYSGLMWEVKRRAKLPYIATQPLAQAEYAAQGTPLYPAAGYREDGGRWIVSMYAEHFHAFCSALAEMGNGTKQRALIRQMRRVLDEMERLL